MPELNLLQTTFNPKKELKPATIDYFKTQLGFDFTNLKTSDQPISIQIRDEKYNLQIVFQLTDEELGNTPSAIAATPGEGNLDTLQNLKYSKYLVCSYDFGALEKIPNKSLLATFNRQLSARFDSHSGMPNLILFRYTVNNKTYITFSVSELREKPNQRTGKYIASKVILLKDVDVENTHRAHLKILENLKQSYANFDEFHTNLLTVLDTKVLGDKFYQEVLNEYNQLVASLVLPNYKNPTENDKKDFALRLIGRLIFCWFLKAKNWIPEEILSSKIIEKEFISQNESLDYYHQILELIFFESLNKDTKDRDYNSLLNQQYIPFLQKVPYLNGGLFEASYDKDFYDSSQSEPNKRPNFQLIVPNQNLKQILELFEKYYFTIDENTSNIEEIGVDPEMMGRIFENFILNRSSTGSFYTPREIVDYMVQTSLKEHLKTKEIPENIVENLFDTKYWTPTEAFKKDYKESILNHLNSLKILDPACGSGAFPMGVLQKLTEIKHTLEPEKTLYEIKKEILENSIYGVDILPIAVEISRLRCWLSLVVDEELIPELSQAEKLELESTLQQID